MILISIRRPSFDGSPSLKKVMSEEDDTGKRLRQTSHYHEAGRGRIFVSENTTLKIDTESKLLCQLLKHL